MGEMDPMALGSGEAKLALRGRVRQSPPPKARRGRAQAQGSGEVEPTPRGWARRSQPSEFE